MVEQDARAGEQSVALSAIDRDPVAVEFDHAVRASRIERRPLMLRSIGYPSPSPRAGV